MRRYRRPILLVLIGFAGLVALIAYQDHRRRRADAMEWRVARLPLGISAAEAERRLGRAPDRITQVRGVIAHSAMMLDASNSLAADYGDSQTYSARIWHVGPLTAYVYTDQNGRVAFRSTSRPPSRPPLTARLRGYFQRLIRIAVGPPPPPAPAP